MTIKFEDFNLDNILIDEKSYQNILVHNISNKNLIGTNFLHIRLNKIDGFISAYNAFRYLAIFGCKKYDFIYIRIRHLIEIKSDFTYVISHNYARIKVDSYDSLPIKETLIFHNVIMYIKSVLKKD